MLVTHTASSGVLVTRRLCHGKTKTSRKKTPCASPVCHSGLLPFLVKSLRSSDLNCKTSALRLVWLALAAKIEPEDIEAAYVHGASTSKQLQEKGAQEGLLNSGFVAIEEMMRLQRAGFAHYALLRCLCVQLSSSLKPASCSLAASSCSCIAALFLP